MERESFIKKTGKKVRASMMQLRDCFERKKMMSKTVPTDKVYLLYTNEEHEKGGIPFTVSRADFFLVKEEESFSLRPIYSSTIQLTGQNMGTKFPLFWDASHMRVTALKNGRIVFYSDVVGAYDNLNDKLKYSNAERDDLLRNVVKDKKVGNVILIKDLNAICDRINQISYDECVKKIGKTLKNEKILKKQEEKQRQVLRKHEEKRAEAVSNMEELFKRG